MKFLSLGGINEHGRNAFLIESPHHKILLDCGLGEKGELPDFSKIDVSTLNALFLSHSHLDHTGAVGELFKRGFHGQVFLSKPTYDCIGLTNFKPFFLHYQEKRDVFNWLSVKAFRSGHCFGAFGYDIRMEEKTIIYTGDYLEDSIFSCDEIRNLERDVAIVDGAYPADEKCMEDNKSAFLKLIASLGKNIILPLPKNGRGIEVISIFNDHGIPYSIVGEPFFHEEENDYLKKKVDIRPYDNSNILLVADPQLKKKESQDIVAKHPSFSLIFTGTVDEGSVSSYLLGTRKNTFFQRINVHQTHLEAEALIKKNQFKKAVIFHNKETKEKTSFSF